MVSLGRSVEKTPGYLTKTFDGDEVMAFFTGQDNSLSSESSSSDIEDDISASVPVAYQSLTGNQLACF